MREAGQYAARIKQSPSIGAPELFLLSAGIASALQLYSGNMLQACSLRLYTEDQIGCYLELEVVETLQGDCRRGRIQMVGD
jgi:hypothetical protein